MAERSVFPLLVGALCGAGGGEKAGEGWPPRLVCTAGDSNENSLLGRRTT